MPDRVRLGVLQQHAIVRDLRPFAERYLSHRVRKVVARTEADKRLDQRDLCLLARNDKRPRVRHDGISMVARDVDDVNGRRQRTVRADEYAVAEKRGVQPHGSIVPGLAVAAEMPVYERLFLAHRLGESQYRSVVSIHDPRGLRHVVTVDEYEP